MTTVTVIPTTEESLAHEAPRLRGFFWPVRSCVNPCRFAGIFFHGSEPVYRFQ